MHRHIRILILEDEATDAELIQRELRKAGLNFTARWAPDKNAFLTALDDFVPDLVLADYSLPGFDGLTALGLARQAFPDLPGIIVSGAIGEEVAIETLKAGATDYVLKERLGRLGPAIRRALEEVEHLTERKKAEQALREAMASLVQAKAAAEEANRAKDHFLAVLSHELRTPLTPVLATVSMLLEDARFDEDTRQALEVVRRNVELEARLIDDLLDVTRIARGKVDLDKQPVELCEVIRRAVEVCKPDIEARKLEFHLDLDPAASHRVEADAARLQQVFWNLLKNAVKFTPPGGCVGVRVRSAESEVLSPESKDGPRPALRAQGSAGTQHSVLVEVSDSGVGIEPESMGRIFHAFEQAERSMVRRFGGLGLGLAISKALVELHGGTIEGQSEGKGKGATFRVRLPLLARPESKVPRPQFRTRSRLGIQESGISRPLRVLLVEDHGDTARIMSRLLARQGYETATAGDVATALEMAARMDFDLVISDLGLPDRNGLELIQELRAEGRTMPAIALSGYGQEEDVRRCHEAGFNAHLTKPVNSEQFFRTIATLAE